MKARSQIGKRMEGWEGWRGAGGGGRAAVLKITPVSQRPVRGSFALHRFCRHRTRNTVDTRGVGRSNSAFQRRPVFEYGERQSLETQIGSLVVEAGKSAPMAEWVGVSAPVRSVGILFVDLWGQGS